MRTSRTRRRSMSNIEFEAEMITANKNRLRRAYLNAAGPDLLEALKGLVSVVGNLPPTTHPDLLNKYRRGLNAISEAEGRS